MKKKSTDELINEIVTRRDIGDYICDNEGEFLDTPLHQYLHRLLGEADLKVSQVVDLSFKGEYVYQVFRGIKKPGRDVLLCIGLALSLDLNGAQELLRVAQMPRLDARNRRDSILIFAFSRGLSVPKTNDLLFEHEQLCL